VCHNHSVVPDRAAAVTATSHTAHLASGGVPYLTFEREEPAPPPGRPLVVIATDIFGIAPFYRHLAGLLAAEGYRVAVPDLFHRVGPARDDTREAALDRRRLLDDRQAQADLEAVIDELAVPGTPYGAIGFCLGGTLALVSAASHPDQATLTWYAFPRGAPGAAVPGDQPVDVAHRITGPVLAFWGRDDYIDPHQVDELAAALATGQSEHQIGWYDQAGHSFLAGLTEPGPSTPAAQDSWRRGLAFLDTRVASA
jgi:dienelactone hydrolase